MTNDLQEVERDQQADRFFLGLLLVGAGLMMLLGRLTVNTSISTLIGILLLPMVGIVFLVWAIYTQRFALSIPGSILLGLGLGIALTQTYPQLGGGVLLLALALGFIGITLLSPFFGERKVWWPIVPAVIIGFLGALLTIGGEALKLLEWINIGAPLLAIAIGVLLLFTLRNRHGHA
ncbi:MAG: hypothetical protein KF726_07380 [Anaerolineae bacterium]|nr:hypothetical protein [Anaerolineae bacterium]